MNALRALAHLPPTTAVARDRDPERSLALRGPRERRDHHWATGCLAFFGHPGEAARLRR